MEKKPKQMHKKSLRFLLDPGRKRNAKCMSQEPNPHLTCHSNSKARPGLTETPGKHLLAQSGMV